MDVNRSYLWPNIHHEERCVRLLICWLITEKSAFSTHAKFIWIVDFNHYSFKISRCFWLDPVPRQILYNQLALTIFGRCDQYKINSMVYLLGNEVGRWYICLETGLLGKQWWLFEDEIHVAEFTTQNWTKEMREYILKPCVLKKSTGRSTYLELKSILNE